jgi:UDP-N-acetylmuramoyl-tripeptide--D-alanyl-D-alanine ligase
MTALWTRDEAVAAAGGASMRDWAASGVSIDSRTIAPGELFVALRDVRDGHDFVGDALARGAAAAMVERRPEGVAEDAPLLVVPDVLEGLRALGRAGRARFGGRAVAVTGSAGKTGTKEMLRTALGVQGRVSAAEKSFNNHWGVPLTLARLDPRADWAVIEIGMNAPGEIEPLARLARPHAAIVTTVAPVHLAAFASIEGIAREKAAIYRGLVDGGAAVMNRDIATYPILLRAAKAVGAVPVRFGATGRPEFRLVEVHVAERATTAKAIVRGQPVLFRLGAPGRHLAMNALGALAAVEAVGGDLARAALALADWRAPEGRGARIEVPMGPEGRDGVLALIDESYNANPAAMAAAFEVFAATEPPGAEHAVSRGRRVAFLGDMLELGADEAAMHAALADLPALGMVDAVHCAGPLMAALHRALPPARRGEWHETAEALAARARRLVGPGDVVMVKGSNGSRIARVVEALKELGEAPVAALAGTEG